MFLNAYALYDIKSQTYGMPFFAVSDPVAVRTAYDGYLMADSTVLRHPEDFTLYRLGLYDDNRGVISGSERVHIVDMVSLIRPPEGDDVDGH